MLFEQRKCYKHFCEEYFLRFLFGTFWNTCTRLYLSTYFLVIPCLVCVVVSLRKRKLKNHSCKNNRNIHAAQTTAFYSLRNRQTLDFYLWVLMNLSLAYYCIVESRVEQNVNWTIFTKMKIVIWHSEMCLLKRYLNQF